MSPMSEGQAQRMAAEAAKQKAAEESVRRAQQEREARIFKESVKHNEDPRFGRGR